MQVKIIPDITQVNAAQWNGMVGENYPFIRHEFLAALEQSGCVCRNTGWQPQHLAVYSANELIACMPLYVKFHSRGEYVFDHQWSSAYTQYGLDYYPKWVTAIPFTPCQGKRIYVRDGFNESEIAKLLFSFLQAETAHYPISSWHCLFAIPHQAEILCSLGLSGRHDVQFHWHNKNYRDFADFLDTFSARHRKKIKRERSRIKEQGIELRRVPGKDITDSQLQAFFQFYNMTYLKKGMHAYLNEDFFTRIITTMADRLLLVLAIKDNVFVGAALSFVGAETLYGRYWGCFDEYHSLHFETCYYQGLDYCIENNLQRFDSGAQGEHKISRGFEPTITYSAHWFRHPEFARAIDRYLTQEKSAVERYRMHVNDLLPYKNCSQNNSRND